MSLSVPIFNGKRDLLTPNSYRGIKLLENAFKLYSKLLDRRLGEVVDINKMQYRFMPRRGTVDSVFVLRRLSEKCRAKIRSDTFNKSFYIY